MSITSAVGSRYNECRTKSGGIWYILEKQVDLLAEHGTYLDVLLVSYLPSSYRSHPTAVSIDVGGGNPLSAMFMTVSRVAVSSSSHHD